MKLYSVILLGMLLVGCSSSSNNNAMIPADIQNEGGVGIAVPSIDTLGVSHGLCESYQITYRLDNDVLTTSNPVFPSNNCAAFYADVDNTERSELMARAFLNTQTLVVLSNDVLTVTTVQNETLEFSRSEM